MLLAKEKFLVSILSAIFMILIIISLTLDNRQKIIMTQITSVSGEPKSEKKYYSVIDTMDIIKYDSSLSIIKLDNIGNSIIIILEMDNSAFQPESFQAFLEDMDSFVGINRIAYSSKNSAAPVVQMELVFANIN